MLSLWHLVSIYVYQIADRDFLFLPVLWVGVLTVALMTKRIRDPLRGYAGKSLLGGVLILSVINYQLEERKEISELRPVRVQDSRLVPLLVERGLVVAPAEAGTWSVTIAP